MWPILGAAFIIERNDSLFNISIEKRINKEKLQTYGEGQGEGVCPTQ